MRLVLSFPSSSAAALGLCALLSAAPALASAAYTFSPFRVASAFGEHAVLQRAPASASVWGWTAPGGVVTAMLNASRGSTGAWFGNATADATGLWVVNFPPTQGSDLPYTVSFSDLSSNNQVWYLDIVFGDVLFCGGQSNVSGARFGEGREGGGSRCMTDGA
jgi:hypothetical protein